MQLARFRLRTMIIVVAIIAFPLWKVIETEKESRRITSLQNRLNAQWQKQAKGVVRGKFDLILFRYSDAAASRLARDDAVRRLQRLGPAADEAVIGTMLDDLAKLGWSKEKSTLWGTRVEVAVDGPRVANITHKPKGKDVRIFDGKDEISYRAVNKQATIQTGRSWVHMIDLDTIFSPARQLSYWKLNSAIKSVDEQHAMIDIGGVKMLCDRNSGFVERLTTSRNGSVLEEIVQHGPSKQGGVIVPRIIADLTIENGKVRMMSIHLIKSSKINEVMNESEFRFSIPPGTKLFDHRKESPHQ